VTLDSVVAKAWAARMLAMRLYQANTAVAALLQRKRPVESPERLARHKETAGHGGG
jgi:hypothetical protein